MLEYSIFDTKGNKLILLTQCQTVFNMWITSKCKDVANSFDRTLSCTSPRDVNLSELKELQDTQTALDGIKQLDTNIRVNRSTLGKYQCGDFLNFRVEITFRKNK